MLYYKLNQDMWEHSIYVYQHNANTHKPDANTKKNDSMLLKA